MAREFMCAYHSLIDTTRCLNDAEFGRLMRAAISYSACGEPPALSGREAVLWEMMRWQIDRDIERYQAFAEKQSENGKKGGRPKKANETQKTQAFSEKPKKAKEKEKDIEPTVLNPPTPLDNAISEFIEFRKSIKKPMTDRAVELFMKELYKLSPDPDGQISIIHQSIMNGWQSVYPLKNERKQRGVGSRAGYKQRPFNESDLDGVLLNPEDL